MIELPVQLRDGALTGQKLGELLEINGESAYYNLTLSEEDLRGLIAERNVFLRYADRLEFGFETLDCIIRAFYKSPYINQFEYTEILNGLQFIFYALKNEAGETFTDEELIELMVRLFDGPCCGSLELLEGQGAAYILELAGRKNGRIKKRREMKRGETYIRGERGGAERGIILSYSERETDMLRQNLAILLEELSEGYTKGRSFSIKAEIAREIARSVLYAAELAGASELYDLNRLRAAYYKGIELIHETVAESRRLFGDVIETRLETPLKSYNDAIKSIRKFFKIYDPKYGAAEIPVEIPYFPVLVKGGREGVCYIRGYLNSLLCENRICRLFKSEYIGRLLSACREKAENAGDWSFMDINIFELVMTNSLFAPMIGRPPSEIVLTPYDEGKAEKIPMKPEALDGAADYFMRFFGLSDKKLATYINEFIEKRLKPKTEICVTVKDILIFSGAEPDYNYYEE